MTKQFDVIVIGAGAAGLSAAVNAASEGLKTVVLDSAEQFGGQAGSSTLIENYAGFAEGVTGQSLTANMVKQARRFKAKLDAPVRACGITRDGRTKRLTVLTDDGEEIEASAIVLATGVQYRKVDAEGLTDFLGRGVSYGSPSLSDDFENKNIFIIGGANSAGQAALHLSKCEGCKVNILIRGNDIRSRMSEYLVERIEATYNIQVRTNAEVEKVYGGDTVEGVRIRQGDMTFGTEADHVFVMIGAEPKAHWLNNVVERDMNGFIHTGNEVSESFENKYNRRPFSHESSVCGLFVAGDIRSGSVKRCASAVGEGAVTVAEIHQFLGLK